jgi:hypothetical protein
MEDPAMKKTRSKGTTTPVVPKEQETAVAWYRGAKVVEIMTTCYSDICLLKRRGWVPETGKAAKEAEPYLIFKLPRKSITFRSKPKRRK